MCFSLWALESTIIAAHNAHNGAGGGGGLRSILGADVNGYTAKMVT